MNARGPLRLVSEPPASAEEPADLSPGGLFRAYSAYVAAIAMKLMGPGDHVDDVIQEVFLRAIKGVRTLREPHHIKSWLATVTVRVARRKLYKRKIAQLLGSGQQPPGTAIAPGASPEERALLAEVYAVLDGVPVNERIAWVLRYVHGETLPEVARLCGCSLATRSDASRRRTIRFGNRSPMDELSKRIEDASRHIDSGWTEGARARWCEGSRTRDSATSPSASAGERAGGGRGDRGRVRRGLAVRLEPSLTRCTGAARDGSRDDSAGACAAAVSRRIGGATTRTRDRARRACRHGWTPRSRAYARRGSLRCRS